MFGIQIYQIHRVEEKWLILTEKETELMERLS